MHHHQADSRRSIVFCFAYTLLTSSEPFAPKEKSRVPSSRSGAVWKSNGSFLFRLHVLSPNIDRSLMIIILANRERAPAPHTESHLASLQNATRALSPLAPMLSWSSTLVLLLSLIRHAPLLCRGHRLDIPVHCAARILVGRLDKRGLPRRHLAVWDGDADAQIIRINRDHIAVLN